MPAPIGFVLITYRDPPQIARLVATLRALYGAGAPIAINHNQDQSSLDPALLPPDVRWVRPHVPSPWGSWGIVEGALSALRLLYEGGEGPDHVALLSGADYPVARPERVLADLRGSGADAFIDARPVHPWRRDPDAAADGPLGRKVNAGRSNQEVCFRRYYTTVWRPLGIRLRVRSPWLAPLLAPFSEGRGCWAGEQWWTMGRRGAEALLRAWRERPGQVRWFAERHAPDEAWAHTVVCTEPGLRVDHRNFRYIDWTSNAPSPRLLEPADVPGMVASGAHFARKFAAGSPALDLLDRHLGFG